MRTMDWVLADGPADGDARRYEQGLRVRREVLGAEHVNRSLQAASDSADRSRNWSPSTAGGRCGRAAISTGARAVC